MPPYFLTRPAVILGADTAAAFEATYAAHVLHGAGLVSYALPVPRWQFLCWLAENKDVLLHGSSSSGITEFEPRKPDDVDEFGDRRAVYAASDGIWPLFYAAMDRERHPMSLINGCFRIADGSGGLTDPFYFFSISRDALRHRPWRQGFVYVLSRETFAQQAPLRVGGREFHVAQWASLVPVRPLARIAVVPEDFPFLEQIRGHDDAVVWERAAADPNGFPWLDEGHIVRHR